jgi:hypothetical protein
MACRSHIAAANGFDRWSYEMGVDDDVAVDIAVEDQVDSIQRNSRLGFGFDAVDS